MGRPFLFVETTIFPATLGKRILGLIDNDESRKPNDESRILPCSTREVLAFALRVSFIILPSNFFFISSFPIRHSSCSRCCARSGRLPDEPSSSRSRLKRGEFHVR